MPNAFTQIHIHCIFAVKFRQALIAKNWQEQLHKYITGIVQNQGHKMIAINSVADHVHLFIGLKPNQSLSDLIRTIKSDSSEWINKEKLCLSLFRWQEGYGAFSYARSQIKTVSTYIENQEEHHKQKSFLDEYKSFLNLFEIEFDERYLFKAPE